MNTNSVTNTALSELSDITYEVVMIQGLSQGAMVLFDQTRTDNSPAANALTPMLSLIPSRLEAVMLRLEQIERELRQ